MSEGDLLHRDELGVAPLAGNWLEKLLGIEEGGPARERMRTLNVATVRTRNQACADQQATVNEVIAAMDLRRVAQIPVVTPEK